MILRRETSARWERAPRFPGLERGQVHVWRVALAAERPSAEALAVCLSERERLEARRFRFARDRDRYVASRSILRHLLGSYLGCRPAFIEIARGTFGKPFLAEGGGRGRLHFNLSHSAGLAVFAFSSEGEVGIDLERSVPHGLDELPSAGFLSGSELDALASLRGRGLHEALLRCWVRKEALVKATGEGMRAPLTEIEVPLAPGRYTFVRPLLGEEEARRWSLSDVHVARGYAACLAAEGEAQIHTWEWRGPGRVSRVKTPEWHARLAGGWRATLGGRGA